MGGPSRESSSVEPRPPTRLPTRAGWYRPRAVLPFVHAIAGFPAVIFTVLLGVVLVYWIFMVLGAVDIDLLGGAHSGAGGADGAADGAMHGHLHAEASVDAAPDGATEAVGHGHAEHADAGDAGGGDGHPGDDGGVLSALGGVVLRRLPMTVTVSLVVIWAWLLSVLGAVLVQPALAHHVPDGVVRGLLFALALAGSIKVSAITARPLLPLFEAKKAARRAHLVGKLAEVTTGRVDGGFGQVLVADGGAGLLIDARFEGGEALKRGEKVIVTAWDAERDVAHVEPIDRFSGLRVDGEGSGESVADGANGGAAAGKRMVR